MRFFPRTKEPDEEQESVFISMTDMTVSFLFIIILLLAYFAQQYSEKTTVPRDIYENVVKERDELRAELEKLKKLFLWKPI